MITITKMVKLAKEYGIVLEFHTEPSYNFIEMLISDDDGFIYTATIRLTEYGYYDRFILNCIEPYPVTVFKACLNDMLPYLKGLKSD